MLLQCCVADADVLTELRGDQLKNFVDFLNKVVAYIDGCLPALHAEVGTLSLNMNWPGILFIQ